MKVSSPALKPDGTIDKRHTCDGEDSSRAVSWSGAPPGTAAFALIVDDPGAPAGTWAHRVVFDDPSSATGLPDGLEKRPPCPTARGRECAGGVSSFSRTGYWGPCPPPGKPHRCMFRVWALSARLGLPSGAAAGQVRKATEGKVLAEGTLTAIYGRRRPSSFRRLRPAVQRAQRGSSEPGAPGGWGKAPALRSALPGRA